MIANTELKDTGLLFLTEGMYPLTDVVWQDAIVSTQFDACKTKVGMSPRYLNDNFYFLAYIENKGAYYELFIESFLRGVSKRYTSITLENVMFPLTLTCEIKNTFHVFKVNDVVVHRMEFNSIPNGKAQVFAAKDETCILAEIKEPQATVWTHNGGVNGVVIKQTEEDDETQQFLLLSDGQTPAYVSQVVPVSNNVTVSCKALGKGTLVMGATRTTLDSPELKEYVVSATYPANTSLDIRFESLSSLTVQEFQLEEGVYSTPYIPNDNVDVPAVREESILTYPAKNNFSEKEGTLYLSVYPKTKISSTTLFQTDSGDMKLVYALGAFSWTVQGQTAGVTLDFDKPVEIVATWSQNEIYLRVNEKEGNRYFNFPARKQVNNLIFTPATQVGYVVIDDIMVWGQSMKIDTINPVPNEANILLRATFQKALGGKGVSWFELPVAPFDGSPILVEKKDGSNMQKVSFFDYETGKYRTYNEEVFLYLGEDFVEVAFDNINADFFDFAIRTEEGEKIGEPYTVKGKQIHFSLSDQQKQDLYRQRIYARYQLNDTYTVDYNIKAVDGYRIDFAKHDGQEKKVFQEGNRFGEPRKLATMIELNPMMNQNHQGFLYITQNQQVTTTFRITVTPEHILADGGTSSTVIIEPLDKDGNFIGSADLDVRVKRGFIHRIATVESAESQRRSGMYVYRYYSPFLDVKSELRNVEEYLTVVDRDSEIGVQYPFLLKPAKKASKFPLHGDERLLLEQRAYVFENILLYEQIEEHVDPRLFGLLDLNKDGKVTLEDVAYLETGQLDSNIVGVYTELKKWESENNETT